MPPVECTIEINRTLCAVYSLAYKQIPLFYHAFYGILIPVELDNILRGINEEKRTLKEIFYWGNANNDN